MELKELVEANYISSTNIANSNTCSKELKDDSKKFARLLKMILEESKK